MRRPVFLLLAGLALALAALLAWWYIPPVARRPPSANQTPAPTPTTAEARVTLYFANRSYVETGDESLPHLVAEERPLNLTETNRAAAAIRALQAGPRTPRAARVIREDLRVLWVNVRGDRAEVNLSRTNLAGGSLEELLLIQGVVRTLTGLPGIRSVLFLVEGERAETLMGHLSVYEPLTVKDVE